MLRYPMKIGVMLMLSRDDMSSRLHSLSAEAVKQKRQVHGRIRD